LGDCIMSLILNGTNGLSDVDGSASTPAVRGTDTNTGIFFPAADTIAFAEGGAEVARFDSSGNLGIGTSSPATKLEVTGNICGTWASGATRFVGSQYLTGSDYQLGMKTTIDTRETQIFAKAADTGGYVTIATGITPTERMRIDGSGNLLVGTTNTTPGYLNTSTGVSIVPNGLNCFSRSGADWTVVLNNNTGSTYYLMALRANGSSTGGITSNGTTASYGTSSDYRLKENIAPMTGALTVVGQLKPVTYKWKLDGSDGQGFIAHELAEVVPDCVVGEKDAVDEEGNIKPQSIDTSFLVATLTAAIQEQQAIITEQANAITALEARLTALEQA
jgi:hypothetical protein